MIKYLKSVVFCGFLSITFFGISQETVNGEDVNGFIVGGGQEFTDANLFVNSVAIVDVSPGGVAVVSDGASELLEAGLPPLGGEISNFIPDIWLNYTYRPISPGDQSEIWIRTNQPIPAGIILRAVVIETGVGGNFVDQGVTKSVKISEVNKKIVNNFGAGYTDDGQTNGYKIQYSYSNNGGNELPAGFSIIYEIIKI